MHIAMSAALQEGNRIWIRHTAPCSNGLRIHNPEESSDLSMRAVFTGIKKPRRIPFGEFTIGNGGSSAELFSSGEKRYVIEERLLRKYLRGIDKGEEFCCKTEELVFLGFNTQPQHLGGWLRH